MSTSGSGARSPRSGRSEPAAALAEQQHAQRGAVPAEGGPEPGEHLLLAGEVQPGAAAGRAHGADLLRDGQPALHERDDLGVARVDRAAQLLDAFRRIGGGGLGAHGMSFEAYGRRTPGTKNAPGSSGPGRLLRRVLSQR